MPGAYGLKLKKAGDATKYPSIHKLPQIRGQISYRSLKRAYFLFLLWDGWESRAYF